MANLTYTLGDFLIRLKNASMAKNKGFEVLSNKQILAVATALKRLGYLDEVKKEKDRLSVSLSFKHKRPVLMSLKLVSKPGLRIYIDASELGKKKGPSIFLLSTPIGIISSKEALKARVGGEALAEIL